MEQEKQSPLKSPSSCIPILDINGHPLSASKVKETQDNVQEEIRRRQEEDKNNKQDRRQFIRTLVQDAAKVVVSAVIAGTTSAHVGNNINNEEKPSEQVEERSDQEETILIPDQQVTTQIHTIFPFLTTASLPIRYFPNADNQLLKKWNIGYEDSMITDHLRLHNYQFELNQDPRQLFKTEESIQIERKKDIELFSYSTLFQARLFDAVLRNNKLNKSSVLGQWHLVRSNFLHKNINVIVGSPTGNNLSALIRGKVRRTEDNRRRELWHEGVSGLNLKFEFSLDADTDTGIIRDDNSYSWSVYRSGPNGKIEEEPLRAKSSVDYLVISVLPNFVINAKSPEDWIPVVLIEGCSSLGTNGAQLLWQSQAISESGALTILQERLKSRKSQYWQALFTITGSIKKKNLLGKEEPFPDGIEFTDFSWIIPENELLMNHASRVQDSIKKDMNRLALHKSKI